jgi:4-methyl-5(b-hydroxyethyl)-thiazole monophosphate biosynthesis
MIYVFLANGFEEVEAMSVIDILRRADLEVTTVGVGGSEITGAHGVKVVADLPADEADFIDVDLMVLPGGQPGADNLTESADVQRCIDLCLEYNVPMAAICAAPMVFGRKGLLDGKKATCYPGCEGGMGKAQVTGKEVEIDGLFITSKGPATAQMFAFTLVGLMVGREKVDEICKGMLYC